MLLELALALTILLLMGAILWPIVGRGTSRAQQTATALDIATLLRLDRSTATLNGVATGTRIDLARRVVTGASGRQVSVPTDVAIEVVTAAGCVEGSQRFVIVFAPDGRSCGGVVALKKEGQVLVVRINWLSGMIDVVELPKS